MAHVSDLIETDIEKYLESHQYKSLLRFITCGSVDDGKSTLIGRLLYESKMIFEDQLAALEADSKKMGTQGENIDFALLVDGLAAEREQGITIDVAYRFFSTDRRKFIVADTPGHEQYTRNMITGASTADLAVILIDARKGVLVQTRRHSYLVSLIGIKQVVLAINKMDLIDYSQEKYDAILAEYLEFAKQIGLENITAIPMSAFKGDNITDNSANMPWYKGLPLMRHLESVPIATENPDAPFRLPVQWVNRPNLDFRGFSGVVTAGTIKTGDRLKVLPSGKESTVASIVLDGEIPEATSGQSVTITLKDEIDISRGDILSAVDSPPGVSDQFEATVVWMNETALLPGRPYLLKIGARTVSANVSAIKHKVNVNTLERLAAKSLELNEIGVCNLSLEQPIAFDAYSENRDTGGFILIDRLTNDTVGAGLIHFALRRAQNIHWQAVDIHKQSRSAQKSQKACVLWFTGLSGAGKSTIANLVEKKLFAMNRHTYMLDGDNVRHGLNRDLGFTDVDRVENIRRVAEVSKLMVDAGLIVLVSFISPFRAERRMARELLEAGEFLEVYVETPLSVAESRDPKGLYKKARKGEIKHFTGINSPYEAPEDPELRIDTTSLSAEAAAERIVERLEELGMLFGGPGLMGAEHPLAKLLPELKRLAEEAGRATMQFYGAPEAEWKADGSPVTAADHASEKVILPALRSLTPDIPVISEEEATAGVSPEVRGSRFWLVDPLDGTKEFIKQNGEFTINIALVEDRIPTLGVVHVPVTGETYAAAGPGTATLTVNGAAERGIKVRLPPAQGLTIVASRSHGDGETLDRFLDGLTVAERRPAGSSVKLCLVARGDADLYPRLGPTMEWDIAAGHAVLLGAGGRIETEAGDPLLYGKPDFRNPHFVAYGGWDKSVAEAKAAAAKG